MSVCHHNLIPPQFRLSNIGGDKIWRNKFQSQVLKYNRMNEQQINAAIADFKANKERGYQPIGDTSPQGLEADINDKGVYIPETVEIVEMRTDNGKFTSIRTTGTFDNTTKGNATPARLAFHDESLFSEACTKGVKVTVVENTYTNKKGTVVNGKKLQKVATGTPAAESVSLEAATA